MIGALVLLLIFLVAFLYLSTRIRAGRLPTLRPIPGFLAARQAIARSAEYGRPMHLSTGPAGVGTATAGTAETLAGLVTTEALAQHCAASGTPVLATTGDGLTFVLAENAVRNGYANVGRLGDAPVGPGGGADPLRGGEARLQGVRLLSHRDPLAYAAALTGLNDNEQLRSTTTVGGWGAEYLLAGESQRRRGIQTIAGASNPEALAVMLLSADHTLLGEEIYAAGAYLQQRPAHFASLLAQDLVRWVIIVLIVVGALLATVNIHLDTILRAGG